MFISCLLIRLSLQMHSMKWSVTNSEIQSVNNICLAVKLAGRILVNLVLIHIIILLIFQHV